MANSWQTLSITTCMSAIADPFCTALAESLAKRLGMEVRIRLDVPYAERDKLLGRGFIQMGWVCGLLYVNMRNAGTPLLPLVAPVMVSDRHHGCPVYFADLIVRRASTLHHVDELQDARWAYNERGSFSGFQALRYWLATQELDGRFLGRGVQSGSHLHSIDMVRRGIVDVAAIDSTVLDMAAAQDATLWSDVRIITSIGPSAMPPWVVSHSCPVEVRNLLRHALLTMHEDAAGRSLLQTWQVARFAPVDDEYYDDIRRKMEIAAPILLE